VPDALPKPLGNPIHVPSNNDIRYGQYPVQRPQPTQPAYNNTTWEAFNVNLPDEGYLYDPRKTAAEAEKDLRNLMEGNFNNDNEKTDVDTSLATVKGFRDGFELLPHQVLGRVWMKEREEGKKFGGILADDMGLV
jgi:SNF2 family DNA or RNA helicase